MTAVKRTYFNYMLRIEASGPEMEKTFLDHITCADTEARASVYFIDLQDDKHTGVFVTFHSTHAPKFNYEFINNEIGRVKTYTVSKGLKHNVKAYAHGLQPVASK